MKHLKYQCDIPCALDGSSQHLLMIRAGSSDASRMDFSFFRLVFTKSLHILEIDVFHSVFAEFADFRSLDLFLSSLGASFSVHHLTFLLNCYTRSGSFISIFIVRHCGFKYNYKSRILILVQSRERIVA